MSEIQKKENTTPVSQERFNFLNSTQFETMQRVCKLFANSELVPDMYKAGANNPLEKAMANCMIAIEIADRIGASPLMVMQNMVPIYGRPSWSSKFLIATVNTCGRFNPLKFKFTEKGKLGKIEYTDYEKVWTEGQGGRKGYYKNKAVQRTFDGDSIKNIECVAYTTIKGSDEVLESSPVSLELAILEGWYTKNGSKWKTMPKQMLMYRAASFWTSAYAPELSMGMRTVEEQQDIIDADFEDLSRVERDVETELESKANGEVIGIETEQDAKEAEPAVDTATGETKNEGEELDF